MKKISYGIMIFSIFIFFLSIFYFNKPIDSWDIYVSFEATDDTGGFDLNNTALTFGKIPKGSSSTRSINFDNNYDFPIRLAIFSEGEIKDYLSYTNKIIVYSKEKEKIYFIMSVPADLDDGYYDGLVKVRIYRFYG